MSESLEFITVRPCDGLAGCVFDHSGSILVEWIVHGSDVVWHTYEEVSSSYGTPYVDRNRRKRLGTRATASFSGVEPNTIGRPSHGPFQHENKSDFPTQHDIFRKLPAQRHRWRVAHTWKAEEMLGGEIL